MEETGLLTKVTNVLLLLIVLYVVLFVGWIIWQCAYLLFTNYPTVYSSVILLMIAGIGLSGFRPPTPKG